MKPYRGRLEPVPSVTAMRAAIERRTPPPTRAAVVLAVLIARQRAAVAQTNHDTKENTDA